MSPTTLKFHHSLAIFLGLAVAALAADPNDLATLRAKAEQGNGVAQYNLGLAYADAQQPSADRAEAYVWLSLAAENGSTSKALATLIEQMSPAQLAEGGRRLQLRRAHIAGSKSAPLIPGSPAETPLARLTAERDQLVASLNTATTELASLRARQVMTPGQPAADAEKLRTELARVENELNEARAAARTLAEKNQQMEDVASERGRALAAAQAELANAKSAAQPAAVSPELAAITAERDGLAEKLARSDRQVALLGSQNMRTLKEAEEQKQQLAALQANVERLTGEKAALAAKLAAIPAPTADRSGEIEKLTAAQAAAEARAQDLAARLAALEKQNAELTARATAAEGKLAAVAATPAPAAPGGADTDETKKQIAEAEAKLATALHSYSLLQQDLDQTREKAGQTETKLANAQAEATTLRAQVDALAPTSKEMTLLRQASINVATEAVGLRDQLRQSQDSVARLAEENAQLRTRLALLGPPPAPLLSSPARYAPTPAPVPTVKSPASQPPQTSATPPAAAAAPAARQHTVVEGDTLSKIARRYYGSSDRWPEILQANRDLLRDERNLPVGASLRIP